MDINTPYIEDPVINKRLEEAMTGRMRYTLMNDFLSKYSLQNDLFALKGLLSALLRLDPEVITAIEILNPVEPGNVIRDKDCILDVKLELNHAQIINIEIQSRHQDFWPERSITYLCRNFDHLKEGQSYSEIKPCVQIGIMSNDLFKEGDPRYTGEFYTEYELLSATKHTGYSSKFSIKVLSLNRLEEAGESDRETPNGLYYWAKLFRAQSWEELKMIANDNPHMTSFVGTVRKLSAEEKISQACEARRRYTQDIATYEGEIKQMTEKYEQVSEKYEQVSEKYEQVSEKYEQVSEKYEQVSEKYEQVSEKYEQAVNERDRIAEENARLRAELERWKR